MILLCTDLLYAAGESGWFKLAENVGSHSVGDAVQGKCPLTGLPEPNLIMTRLCATVTLSVELFGPMYEEPDHYGAGLSRGCQPLL